MTRGVRFACALAAAWVGAGGRGLAQVPTQRPTPRATPRGAAGDMIELRVRNGDTCVAIAQRLYGDRRRTDLIHTNNPWMGPPPHRLRAGMVLRVPRTVPVTSAAPDAILTAVHNQVEIYGPAPRRPQGNDPLFRGMRVSTLDRSSAEVTFADETQLRLSEQTLVVILGETNTRVRRLATASDTTLERGELVAHLGSLAGRASIPIQTGAARVVLGRGEARVQVDAERRTTLAVYQGRSQVTAQRATVPVSAGYGLRAERGRPLPRPRLLPVAPTWVTAPPTVILTDGTSATLTAEYRAGAAAQGAATPPTPARWHVQVARDEHFIGTIVDERAPAGRTRLEARDAAAGPYFLRVSAVDAENFEGPASAVTRTRVVPVVPEAGATPRASRVRLPAGIFCGLDGGALQPVGDTPLDVDRRREHTLRCASDASGEGATETVIAAAPVGPLRVSARFEATDARARQGRVTVRVLDASGHPLARDRVAVTSSEDVTVGAPTDAPQPDPASFAVAVTWRRPATEFALRVTVDGEDPTDTERFRTPDELAVAPPVERAPERWYHRLSLRTEVGAGAMVAQPTQGSAADFGVGYGWSARLGFDLVHPEGWTTGRALTLQASGSRWLFPTTRALYGAVNVVALGLRFEPLRGRNRVFVDANGGAVLTGALARAGFDVGLGFEHVVGAPAAIGLFVRYVHVIEPGDEPWNADACFVVGGVTFTLRPASPRYP